jgi:lipopolysaccharide-induced tumor necrosis factor-alpha factor
MDKQNPHCSHDTNESETLKPEDVTAESELQVKKICTNTSNLNTDLKPPNNLSTNPSNYSCDQGINNQSSLPLVIISRPPSLVAQSVVSPQPQMPSNLPSPLSLISGQPQSLFIQALTKLNQSSIDNAVMNHFRSIQVVTDSSGQAKIVDNNELSTPDSLASAPPSYSFVLRQMATRRRPRIVGTFIPSPSFVQPTPPPNYTAAFDIYIDAPMPPPPRVYNFGFASMPVVCPDCGYTGMSMVTSKITLCTHLCAVILCVLCCWVCAPLPYILRSCKDVYHYCRNCRNFLGMYCPTNPENTYN